MNECSLLLILFSPTYLPNKIMDFLFPLLKLPNKGREEYSKIILFIPFHSLLLNEGLRLGFDFWKKLTDAISALI